MHAGFPGSSSGKESALNLTHVAIGRIQFLLGCWTENLSSLELQAARPCFLPSGPLSTGYSQHDSLLQQGKWEESEGICTMKMSFIT